jgi:hypothetical protein
MFKAGSALFESVPWFQKKLLVLLQWLDGSYHPMGVAAIVWPVAAENKC